MEELQTPPEPKAGLPGQGARESAGGVVSSVAKGAISGASKGGAHGAAVGAAKGAITGVLKTKSGRAIVAGVVTVWLVVNSLLAATIGGALTSSVLNASTANNRSLASTVVAKGAGVNDDAINVVKRETANTAAPWQLVLAIYKAQTDGNTPGGAAESGVELNPFRIADNPKPVGLAEQSRYIANLVAQELAATPGLRYGMDIAEGAFAKDGQVQWVLDEQERTRRKNAYVTALSTLPLEGVNESWASGVYDTALAWRLGVPAVTAYTFGACAPVGSDAEFTVDDASGTQVRVTQVMLNNAAIVVNVGKGLGVSNKGMVVAIMTALQESSLRNLASELVPESKNYPNDGVAPGNAQSVNVFQQQPWWGPDIATLMKPDYAAAAFYGRPPNFPNHPKGLLDIQNGESLDYGAWAQAVQASAFPDAYDKWKPVAEAIVGKALGIACTSGTGSANLGSAAGVIELLKSKLGTPYSWGGGGINGPSLGFGPGANVVGFDCSSYMQWGIYQATNGAIDISRSTESQTAKYKGTSNMFMRGPELSPGDLLYWGAPGSTWHVAMYIGNDRVIEETTPGSVAKINPLKQDYSHVIRLALPESKATLGSFSSSAPGTWLRPLSAPITSPFGYRTDPINGQQKLHSGTDFGAPCGTPVKATETGTVFFTGPSGTYGNRVVITHTATLSSAYNHLQSISVTQGQQVKAGDIVGLVGTTGRSTGCHLHFQVMVDAKVVDPMPYLGAK